ncbi:hypothetical protein [Methylocystis sp. B8]|uniref:hypothetical protein n=1 Tax=Methylocystis sp. B8 TaxID=544938 RepID=UPI0010FDC168|nr:hypothetical protein [Methylocystis sp. B8]TLG75152.1 hypothetical protein FEV16_11630 [Methylocystis sp. B8]
MSKSYSSLAEWAAAFAAAQDVRRNAFDAATGGAPRVVDGAEIARAEAEVLRFKMTWQRNRMREIFKASPVHQDQMDGLMMLDDMLVTAMRLGALELTNDKRDRIEATRKGRAAGKRRGAQLSAEAEGMWKPHALQLAQDAQRKDPTLLLQKDLAETIKNGWRLNIHCPTSQLVRAVRAWQREGRLLRRKGRSAG